MPDSTAARSLLRDRSTGARSPVTFVELFFDLVFVFAVTQVSHSLLQQQTPLGALHAVLMLMAVWWVWIYTSWVTNWLDPQRTPVRLMLFALMLAGLVLSTSLPKAFGAKGLYFAAAYAFMQVGRCLFMLWALQGRHDRNFRNFQRITVWLGGSAVFWIAGGIAEGNARLALWLAALAIEYLSPSLGFWVPRLGRSTTTDWDIDGGHLAERCGLFIIIALGESIVVTGASFAGLDWTHATAAAFAVAFVSSVAMWWIYFNIGAERASQHIAASADPGRLGRLAYTYIHVLIVAGIIIAAVADELILAHPLGHTGAKTAGAVLGGPALFLVGNIFFKLCAAGRPPLSHLVGLVLLAGLIPAAGAVPPVALAAAAMAVLIVVGLWEAVSLRGVREMTIES
jgi:low temperature requirement protein LtrA